MRFICAILISMKYKFVCLTKLKSHAFVYAWKRDDQWLYAGCTHSGFSRIETHNIIKDIQEKDCLYIWYPSNRMFLLKYEKLVIDELQPYYNKRGNEVNLNYMFQWNPDLIVYPIRFELPIKAAKTTMRSRIPVDIAEFV